MDVPCRPTSGGSPSSAPGTAAPAPGAGTCRQPAASTWRSSASATSIRRGWPWSPATLGLDGAGGLAPTSTRCSAAAGRTRSSSAPATTPMPTSSCTRSSAGIDVVTEKPMATTAEDCRRILDAEARTGRRVDVAFNYRFAPTSRKIRELLASGRIGEVTSVDFHWYLDTVHGADYFRRWHAYKRHSGSLFVHKATHHFDLLNWWIDADPVRVFAQGRAAQVRRRRAVPLDVRCKGCPHAGECEFYLDIAKSPWLDVALRGAVGGGRLPARRLRLPRGHRHLRHDDRGDPLRERRAGRPTRSTPTCRSRAITSPSTAPRGGSRSACTRSRPSRRRTAGTRSSCSAPTARSSGSRSSTGRAGISAATRCCTGASSCRRPTIPIGQRAGARAGALSVLTGVAATRSAETGRPVDILPLLEAG